MKLFKIFAPVALSLGAAFPAMAQGELTCWYNEAGQGTGADSGTHGGSVGQVVQDRPGHSPPSSGDWYWAYVLAADQWTDGNSCPPALDMSGYQSATTVQDPAAADVSRGELTCWYDEAGESAGADSGNRTNAPLYESVQNTLGGGGGPWIYVLGDGEWTDGNSCPDSISVSGAVGPAAPGTMPNATLTPGYGTVDLTAGFTPDPYQVNLYAGGIIASDGAIAECYAGWIAEGPDFRLNFTATTNPQLTISATSDSDTTLVIQDPRGNWVCNDDTNALDPAIVFSSPVSGQYNIWVGTFGAPRIYPPATLSITEY